MNLTQALYALPLTLVLACSGEKTFLGSAQVEVPEPKAANDAPAAAEATPAKVVADPYPSLPMDPPPAVEPTPADVAVAPEKIEIETTASMVESTTTTVPGAVKVTKVGVNFEDVPDADPTKTDYNDAVLCFEGGFEVKDTSLISYLDQTVEGSFFSEAGCTNEITVRVMRGTSEISSVKVNPKVTRHASILFKRGDRLDVSFESTTGACPKGLHSMNEPAFAKVAANVCNDH